jgi:hypothetical protein
MVRDTWVRNRSLVDSNGLDIPPRKPDLIPLDVFLGFFLKYSQVLRSDQMLMDKGFGASFTVSYMFSNELI